MDKLDLSVDIAGMHLKNPVIAASGTFGFGREFSELTDLNAIGGISVKGLTLKPRDGNPPPRIAETPAGILNSVGLQNPGVHAFIEKEIPFLRQFDTRIIANVAGSCEEEYTEMARILNNADIDAIELNVSCPNVKHGCCAFGASPSMLRELVKAVKKEFRRKPLIVKLTPNVNSITEVAKAAEEGGADSVSLINTLLGMKIDIYKKKPLLANVTGGLSGPCVRPVAVRMVYEVSGAVSIPVIGMGGIQNSEDAVEFLLAGSKAVMIGTANFVDPNCCADTVKGIKEYMTKMNIQSISQIRRI